jgi:hypothetical protein
MEMKFSSTHLLQGTEGYGQLSISSSAVRIVAATQNAAGVWALVGPSGDVDKLKPAGPATSAAVVAHSTDNHIAIAGDSQLGIGVSGTSHNVKAAAISGTNPGGLAGSFNGNVVVSGLGTFGTLTTTSTASFPHIAVTGNLDISGIINVAVGGDIQMTGADCAEQFDVTEAAADPGTVMVVGESEKLAPCDRSYDTRVAGVVSGAEEYRPALILDRRETGSPRRPIALVGKVYCKVDAEYGAIAAGDLLTTSPTPGHAMKASDDQITVKWTSQPYNKFLIWWTQNGVAMDQGEIDDSQSGGSWTASPITPGALYTFSVKGGVSGGIGGNYLYSDWARRSRPPRPIAIPACGCFCGPAASIRGHKGCAR